MGKNLQDIIDYISDTPENTNLNVLIPSIEEYANSNTGLPEVTEDDNGDILGVVDGAWAKTQPSGDDVVYTLLNATGLRVTFYPAGGFYALNIRTEEQGVVGGLDDVTFVEMQSCIENAKYSTNPDTQSTAYALKAMFCFAPFPGAVPSWSSGDVLMDIVRIEKKSIDEVFEAIAEYFNNLQYFHKLVYIKRAISNIKDFYTKSEVESRITDSIPLTVRCLPNGGNSYRADNNICFRDFYFAGDSGKPIVVMLLQTSSNTVVYSYKYKVISVTVDDSAATENRYTVELYDDKNNVTITATGGHDDLFEFSES